MFGNSKTSRVSIRNAMEVNQTDGSSVEKIFSL